MSSNFHKYHISSIVVFRSAVRWQSINTAHSQANGIPNEFAKVFVERVATHIKYIKKEGEDVNKWPWKRWILNITTQALHSARTQWRRFEMWCDVRWWWISLKLNNRTSSSRTHSRTLCRLWLIISPRTTCTFFAPSSRIIRWNLTTQWHTLIHLSRRLLSNKSRQIFLLSFVVDVKDVTQPSTKRKKNPKWQWDIAKRQEEASKLSSKKLFSSLIHLFLWLLLWCFCCCFVVWCSYIFSSKSQIESNELLLWLYFSPIVIIVMRPITLLLLSFTLPKKGIKLQIFVVFIKNFFHHFVY